MENFAEFQQELTAPVKSIRLFAIEKAIKAPPSKELLGLLLENQKIEDDSECLMMLRHAINKLTGKLEEKTQQRLTVDEILKQFSGQTPDQQLELISLLKAGRLKEIEIDLLPSLLSAAADRLVVAEIVKKFRRQWPESMVGFLEKHMFSSSKSLQLACMETLMKRFPEKLKDKLTRIVHINDPIIRSTAMYTMARYYPALASDFINDCFERGDYFNKVLALQVCSTIDFAIVKSSILNLILAEADQKIFNAACMIILNNPDKEIPFRLMDIISKTTRQKSVVLNKLLPGYCRTIKIAGICEDFDVYMKSVKEYAGQIKARIFVNNCIAALDSAQGTERIEALSALQSQLSNEDIKEMLVEYLKQNPDCKQHDTLQKLLGKTGSKNETEEEFDHELESYEDKEKKLIKEFARARFKKSEHTIEKLKVVLESDKYSQTLRILALKAAVFLDVEGYVSVAQRFAESDDEAQVAAGLEYLSRFYHDSFHDWTQKLLNSDSLLIKRTLIKETSRSNPQYAKFLINHMLNGKNKSVRKNGLEATVQLDFSFIMPDLLKFLEKEGDAQLFNYCLSLFIANPKLETLFHLNKIKEKKVAFTNEVAEAQSRIRQLLISISIATNEEIEQFLQEKKRQEQNLIQQREKQKQLFAIKNKIKWAEPAESSISFFQLGSAKWVIAFSCLAAFILIGFTVLFWPTKSAGGAKSRTRSSSSVRTKFKNVELPAEGSMVNLELISFDKELNAWIARHSQQKKEYRVLFKHPQHYKAGQIVGVDVKNARHTLTGQIVVFADNQ